MTKSFTGEEFIKALAEGTLQAPIIMEGMVKKCESSSDNAFLFSQSMSCVHWTQIPSEMIEKVEYISIVQCRDHEHPYVRLTLKEPSGDAGAQVFADLLRHSARSLVVEPRDFPVVDSPILTDFEGLENYSAQEAYNYNPGYLRLAPSCSWKNYAFYCGGRWYCVPWSKIATCIGGKLHVY